MQFIQIAQRDFSFEGAIYLKKILDKALCL